ncbi:MAG: GMC family oxidoreductase [bacterium]
MTTNDPPLSPRQYAAARSLLTAMIPAGERVPAVGDRTINTTIQVAADMSGLSPDAFGKLIQTFDLAAVASTGRRFQKLSADAQDRLLQKWERSPVMRWPLWLLSNMVKISHFDHTEVYANYGVDFPKGGPAEPVNWLGQVECGEDWEDDEELECDVVVVGTGPGGAIVGKELAEEGHAVVFVEEGKLHRRDSFDGSGLTSINNFYRGHGTMVAWGNGVVPILAGRLVGGSTAINTAICFRTPEWILDEWCERLGTDQLTAARLERHFERVERHINVQPNDPKVIGPVGDIVARGCDKLGWSHFVLRRNAPDCDSQGCCDWGCPSGARLSMDRNYIPMALERGSVLFTESKATRVVIENGKAVGIVAESVVRKKKIRIRAQAVVLAGGAVPTPLLLLSQGICNSSGQLGRNLSLHPGVPASAEFDHPVEAYKYSPSGVGVDQFHREGFMLVNVGLDINMVSSAQPINGRRFTEFMDKYDRIATMGVLVKDSTRNGRVRVGPGGSPLVSYWLQKADLRQLRQGVTRIFEIFRAAGAKRCYPLGHRMPVLESREDVEAYRTRKLVASDLVWTAFHPLGTAEMGYDPATSVVNLDHETHDVKRLFIVDGSTVPGPTAVNPQLTIMAMATRAAERINKVLD